MTLETLAGRLPAGGDLPTFIAGMAYALERISLDAAELDAVPQRDLEAFLDAFGEDVERLAREARVGR